MSFRKCVIDCIAEGHVVQTFNRLHDKEITPELLARLEKTEENQLALAELDHSEQEVLACFILFVHHHVWRKVKLAEARVTGIYDGAPEINLSRLHQVRRFDSKSLNARSAFD